MNINQKYCLPILKIIALFFIFHFSFFINTTFAQGNAAARYEIDAKRITVSSPPKEKIEIEELYHAEDAPGKDHWLLYAAIMALVAIVAIIMYHTLRVP